MIKACELGPQTFPWWPNWKGQYGAIIACGPSAKKADLSQLKGKVRIIAIKQAFDLCPWADVVYGCDYPWWEYRRGLREFKGLKICFDDRARAEYGVVKINVRECLKQPRGQTRYSDEIILDEPGVVGGGGNSGFQSLNLAAQFGLKGILLVGFDASGDHFYGRNNWARANNPDEGHFRRWRAAFNGGCATLRQTGIDVVNASLQSSITAFRKASIQDTIRDWGLVSEAKHLDWV